MDEKPSTPIFFYLLIFHRGGWGWKSKKLFGIVNLSVLSQWLISLSQDYTCLDAPQMPFPGINVSVLGSLNPMWLLTHLVGELSLTFQNLCHFSEIERKHIC